jgi:hypothetical protein
MKHNDLITEFVTMVKQNPSVTLAQYNTWLGKKQWYEQAIVRYFVYKTAVGLAEHHNVSITSYTETFVLGKVRDWLVATPARHLEKIIFNR